MDVNTLYEYLFISACIILGILMLFAIIKSIIGPKVADRLVAVNMLSTMVIMMICILTILYDAPYLDDVALVYVMISFVAIVVLTNVFVNVNMRKKYRDELKNKQKEEDK